MKSMMKRKTSSKDKTSKNQNSKNNLKDVKNDVQSRDKNNAPDDKVYAYASSPIRMDELYCSENGNYGFQSPGYVAIFVAMVIFGVYWSTIHDSLPGGDSGELIVAAYEIGVAHPPGYPLFTMLSQLFIFLLPFGSVAWRVNLMTAACGAATAGVFYALVFSVTRNPSAAVLGSGLVAFSRLFWLWSMSAEVFSLNNLLISILMLLSVKLPFSYGKRMKKISVFGSFVCGLCLSNQHTSVLFIAFLVPWVFIVLIKEKLLSVRHLLTLSVAFVLGLSPYLYLPLSSTMHRARWTWGDQSTLSGFLKHLLRKEYGTWDLPGKSTNGTLFPFITSAYMNHVAEDLSLPVSLLCAFCPLLVFNGWRSKRHGGVLRTFFLMLIFYICFFAWRANLDIGKPLFFKVVERFWMQADLVLVLMAAVSYNDVARFVEKRVGVQSVFCQLLIVLPIISAQAYKCWPICNQRANLVIHDFALQSLDAFPNGSIILTKGDLPSNSYRYFHLCENVRPDLQIFDQEVMTYEWSVPMMRQFYPGIVFPGDFLYLQSGVVKDGKRSFTFKDLIDLNIESRPVFACIGVQDHEPSWQQAYELRPFGVCWKMVKKGAPLKVEEFSQEAQHFARHWSYTWTEARTATGLYLLELAMPLEEGSPASNKLLLQAYKIFTSAIEENPSFPPTWHRNYAITCEKLTRAKTSLKQVDLLQKTVVHFSHFIKLNPHDADAAKIRRAIETLQKYLASVK